MVIRVIQAASDADAVRSTASLLGQLPGVEPFPPAGNSTALLDQLASLAAESVAALPEVVLVHESITPLPALELVREIALRFPAVGTVLLTGDPSPAVYSAAMEAGARGVLGLPLGHDDLTGRVHSVAQWAAGVRRHLGGGDEPPTGPGGRVITVSGAKGGVGCTLTAVQLALAAQSGGGSVALVDLDLQSGDVASFVDVQFRRSIADLAGISDLSVRVLQDAVFAHPSGLNLLLAPAEGERAEEVTEAAARQILGVLRARYETVVIDCGAQLTPAGAAAVETADTALIVTTPDVVAVRGVKRMLRLWERLQIRKAEDAVTVVNRHTRTSELQPQLIQRLTGTRLARTTVPANFRELQGYVDSARLHELDGRGNVRRALWALAAELGVHTDTGGPRTGRGRTAGRGKTGRGKDGKPEGGGGLVRHTGRRGTPPARRGGRTAGGR
ncbi:AAA family ATPase [Streptomyces alkaliterrae]|uniref:AAA family ATPase n=1 Tax=Streptomyces alkaliterrae TaxID=2213162 RepID=A0A7W3WTD4_9ACTN|nr:AAA family ATPase [Streptomyces alkaliterrae]MBB1256811.1 AAA family ATPase [Streptomyces alkaliterrae]MBB1258151.1 AAA family ATPase [Streptomyces alkaliterrae]